jgi:hypothetical protein
VSRWPSDYRVELEAFWRSHHEAWRRSELNQREYCEVHVLPLKRFGNGRAKFKQEPEAPQKVLYRRGGGLEQSRFFWPLPNEATGSVMLTSAQLSMLIGVDWRSPEKRWLPSVAG